MKENRNNNRAVGLYLRRLRKAKKWRIQDIAEQMRVSTKTIERWEHGTTQPAFPITKNLVLLLDGSFTTLLRVAASTVTSERELESLLEAPEPEAPEPITAQELIAVITLVSELNKHPGRFTTWLTIGNELIQNGTVVEPLKHKH